MQSFHWLQKVINLELLAKFYLDVLRVRTQRFINGLHIFTYITLHLKILEFRIFESGPYPNQQYHSISKFPRMYMYC